MGSVSYFSEDINFTLSQKRMITKWIKNVIAGEGHQLQHLNFIFCSDDYLLQINQHYLSHDYFTDIITFNIGDMDYTIEGDIFISIDRVMENASLHQKHFLTELHRVIIHGILHLLGYDDHGEDNVLLMRQKEDSYLSLLLI